MALNPTSPGVYINEIQTLPSSIAGVATAIPAFIGYTEKAIIDGSEWDYGNGVAPPTRITSLLEFEEIFGTGKAESFDITINDNTTENTRTITASFAGSSPTGYNLYQSMALYFANGGGPCYVVSVKGFDGTNSLTSTQIINGIEALKKYDEPTIMLFPDAVNLSTGNVNNYGQIVQAALSQCALLKDRFVISDLYGNSVDSTDVDNFRDAVGAENLSYGSTYTPFLKSLINYSISESSNYSLLIDGTPDSSGTLSSINPNGGATPDPNLYNAIIQYINSNFYITLPPSGAMAGIFARTDRNRGVWKAPANTSVNSIVGPTINITEEQQGGLNIDPTSGKSINALRPFTGKGTLVWGARTLAGNSNEWRYVNVRRLFMYVEESIQEATEFVVFEPNTANTWLRVKSMIEAFLTSIWRDGALAGATKEEAFFVRVGLGTTMTQQDVLEGRMIVEIGLAAVRPAEFIILNFLHKLQES